MLLFYLLILSASFCLFGSFNTSHVTVLQSFTWMMMLQKAVSIHLMLLFYLQTGIQKEGGSTVSIHLMLLFYITAPMAICDLSTVSIHLMLLFYNLKWIVILKKYLCFNTSHVTVLLPPQLQPGMFLFCFNTSHVTVLRAYANRK